jgi:hypothetical protein
MLAIGSVVNFSTSALALLLYALGTPVWLSLGFWGLPIPYNLALFAAVWLAAARDTDAGRAWTARLVALCWLPLMLLI